MDVIDYMAYYLPEEGSEAYDIAAGWRAEFILQHTRVREFALSHGATGIMSDSTNGLVHGLVFDRQKPLPSGWKWKNALMEFAVPINVLAQDEKIIDLAAARRIRDQMKDLGTFETQVEAAKRAGFLVEYEWEWDAVPKRGYSTLGPDPVSAQVLFVGSDGPVCYLAPDAAKVHRLFNKEQVEPKDIQGFRCVNGADTWSPPEGCTEITANRWSLLSAEYKVSKE